MFRFNEESPFWQTISLLVDFFLLNLLFIIVCLPIVTIGPALCALFYVTVRFSDQERGYLVKDFIRELKQDFIKRIGLGVVYSVILALFGYTAWFWYQQATIGTMMLAIVAFLCCVMTIVASIIGFAMAGRFYSSIPRLVKNSYLLVFITPLYAGGLVLILAVLVFLAATLSFFWGILAAVGFSFTAYCMSFLLQKILKHVQ